MNRRKLLSKLLGTCALVALAPRIAFGELSKPSKAQINPLWEKAEYEVYFMGLSPEIIHQFEMKAFKMEEPSLQDFISHSRKTVKI